jgi:hypothetical protein
MKKVTQLCALALCFFFAGNYQGHAQSKDQTFDARNLVGGRSYVFTLRNGDNITAVLDSADLSYIHISDNIYGPRRVLLAAVRAAKETKLTAAGFYPNPDAGRYFYGPTAILNQKGDRYFYTNFALANLSYAPSKYVTTSLGTVWLLDLFGVLNVNPSLKVGLEISPNLHVATGGTMILGYNAWWEEGFAFALPFVNATLGGTENNVTLGLGLAGSSFGSFQGFEWAQTPTVTMGFSRRISERYMIVSENYLISNDFGQLGIVSGFLRRLNPRNAWDYGFAAFIYEGGGFAALPLASYALRF